MSFSVLFFGGSLHGKRLRVDNYGMTHPPQTWTVKRPPVMIELDVADAGGIQAVELIPSQERYELDQQTHDGVWIYELERDT